MNIEKQKIIRRMEEVTEAVGDMNKAMNKTPEQKVATETKIDEFKKKFPDALYIQPKERRPTGGIRSPEYEKRNGGLEYLLEYVVGVFESPYIVGKFEFDLGTIPGEDYCRWAIPFNKPIGVPRFVAKHLSENLAWKEMKPLGKNQEPQAFEDGLETTPFTNFETKRRGTFHPINAY